MNSLYMLFMESRCGVLPYIRAVLRPLFVDEMSVRKSCLRNEDKGHFQVSGDSFIKEIEK